MPAYVYGGQKLLQRLQKLSRDLGRGTAVRVGFLAGATYPNSKKQAIRAAYKLKAKRRQQGAIAGTAGGLPVAQVAAWNEWGDPANNRPARPFFRNMISTNKGTWGEELGLLLKANSYNSVKALALMGERMRNQLQASIREGKFAKLADSTIEAKGFDKTLIDTAHMLNSADYEVAE